MNLGAADAVGSFLPTAVWARRPEFLPDLGDDAEQAEHEAEQHRAEGDVGALDALLGQAINAHREKQRHHVGKDRVKHAGLEVKDLDALAHHDDIPVEGNIAADQRAADRAAEDIRNLDDLVKNAALHELQA